MRTLALAVASLLATLVVACGDDDGTAQEGDGGPAKVVVGVIPIADVAPAWLGAEKGFFREEDIDISFRPIAGGAEVIPQVLRGDVQFAFGNPVSLAFAQQRGLELRYVTEGVQGGSSENSSMSRGCRSRSSARRSPPATATSSTRWSRLIRDSRCRATSARLSSSSRTVTWRSASSAR